METKDWYAWINAMPPLPDDFHVVGEVYVGNPGVQVEFYPRQPQGINPSILLLELHLEKRSGIWTQQMTWVQGRYDKVLVPGSPRYTEVEIFHDGESIAHLNVDLVE
ncbi:MAG: hypothetical protein ACP59X_10905 [Solidesulfovibrio sp. DCME]|uniref:hypothetical protein n=1 Tax=Solidesulfovibrio sp. DCME TaxID=3447380 RepID=UPI003D0A320F